MTFWGKEELIPGHCLLPATILDQAATHKVQIVHICSEDYELRGVGKENKIRRIIEKQAVHAVRALQGFPNRFRSIA